jgi:hypothetical protein
VRTVWVATALRAIAFRNPDGTVVAAAANALDRPRVLVFDAGAATVAIEAEAGSFNTLVVPAGR